ncbi:MAG: xanthine dehydrogenase family protein molybdopterin-binding subunit [Solirubrobacteraceae bacterium]|jgi:4-hydroxybenzoyl-CoA reductase alpha subunit
MAVTTESKQGPARGTAVVGGSDPKIDAHAKATGQTVYTDDIHPPRMLVGRLLRSPHRHARILRVDVTRAAALPGVHGILTGRDLPISYGIMPVAQDEHALALEKVRYHGEPVAAVAAIDEETAEHALRLIEVEYDELAAVSSIEDAMRPDLPLIDGDGVGRQVNRRGTLEFGDVAGGFQRADRTYEDLFFFEGNTHLPMEEHAAVAQWEPEPRGRVTIWSSTQVPHYLHRTLAKVLELSPERIRVVAQPVGGGFGGKSDPFSHELCAARLAMLTGRPVKFTLTREEVFYAHRGRHPVLMRVQTGFQKDGTLTAMGFRTMLDGGAFGSYGPASTYYTGALQPVTYHVPAYKFEAVRVLTNKPACGPKRGHGTVQPRFALECHLDKVATDLGIDPIDLRLRNLIEPFSRSINHMRVTSCGLRECIELVEEASGWREKHGQLPHSHGVGFAVGAYMCGAGLPIYFNDMSQSEVHIKLDRGGGVTVYSMAIDIGQGSDHMLVTIVAEVLGLRPRDIALIAADTDLTPIDLGSYSSRVTFMAGNAAVQAAQRMRDKLFAAVSADLGVPADRLRARDARIFDGENPNVGMDWPAAVGVASVLEAPLVTAGSYKTPKLAGPYKGAGVGPSPAYSYTAAIVELECNPGTGIVDVDRVWIAHDIGKPLNRTSVEGQIVGGVYMGIGEALYEEQVFRRGYLKNPSLLEYRSPTFLEMPEVETFLVETDDPEGPFGAKEVGQGPLLPVIPAVANAIYDAVGVRIDEVPISPDKVVRALQQKAKRKEPRVGPTQMPEFDYGEPIKVDPPEQLPGQEVVAL